MESTKTCIQNKLRIKLFCDKFLEEIKKIDSLQLQEGESLVGLEAELAELIAALKHDGVELSEEQKTTLYALLHKYSAKEMNAIDFTAYPLPSISLEESMERQFRLVDIMHRHFNGYEALEAGDYGVALGLGRPRRTAAVEKVIAEFFHAEDCCLVRGAGSGAIRAILFAVINKESRVLVHDAIMYATTNTTFKGLGAEILTADFNDFDTVKKVLQTGVDVVYIQRTRQKISDSYDTVELIRKVREVSPDVKIIVDENYAVLKVEKLGCEAGADVSTFSMFKVQGVPGVGCVVGTKEIVSTIREQNYSGGGQVQGPEAMECLRGLVNTAPLLGVQKCSVEEIMRRLNAGEVKHVAKAIMANIEERILLVKLDLPISREVVKKSIDLGALPYPVGSESRFEVHTLFYRVARTMLERDPIMEEFVIRINPMRAGPDTIIRILDESIKKVLAE